MNKESESLRDSDWRLTCRDIAVGAFFIGWILGSLATIAILCY